MVYVIIIAYTDISRIQKLVYDFDNYILQEHQIIVVDNKGDTEIESFVTNHKRCKYLSKGNLGYGKGFNYAIQSIYLNPTDLFLLSNDDISISTDAMQQLFKGLKESKSINLHTGLIMPMFVDKQMNAQLDRYENITGISNNLSTVHFGPAALWLMTYGLIQKVGGFLPLFFMYAEDKEYVFRIRSLGITPLLAHNSHVEHVFEYPPKDNSIRLEKERNTIASHYLNLNRDKLNPHIVACKGMIYSIVTLQPARLFYGVLGYIKFLLMISNLSNSRKKIKSKAPFLFLK